MTSTAVLVYNLQYEEPTLQLAVFAALGAGERWLWERYVAQLSAGLTDVKEGGTLEMMTAR